MMGFTSIPSEGNMDSLNSSSSIVIIHEYFNSI